MYAARLSIPRVTARSRRARNRPRFRFEKPARSRRLNLLTVRVHELQDVFDGVLGLNRHHGPCPRLDFHFTFGQRLLANADANGKTDQFGVFEFDARPVVAVVQDDIHVARRQLGVDLFGAFHDFTLRGDVQRRDAHGVRRNADRPDDAVVVMALFDKGLQSPRDANAVTAHDRGLLFASFVEEPRVESFAVFGAEFEDVPDFNGALHFQGFAAFVAGFAGPD